MTPQATPTPPVSGSDLTGAGDNDLAVSAPTASGAGPPVPFGGMFVACPWDAHEGE
ncbi:hypothetical protein GCM10010254_02870 [Streptomyces chromofuscus]|nr:hypothetical protein GCM10010254_02870 [Streptomyces chromofuscus]